MASAFSEEGECPGEIAELDAMLEKNNDSFAKWRN
jgi:hypothetical protein